MGYHWLYLLALLISIAGLLTLDARFKLVLFRSSKNLRYILLAIGFFLAWDIAGIILDIFATDSSKVVGVWVGTPNLPLEEFLFLFLLCHLSALLVRVIHD